MIESYFDKKVEIKLKNEDIKLPSVGKFFSSSSDEKHKELQVIKQILNHVKSKLNNFQIQTWTKHTRSRNPAQQIIHYLKTEIQGEFVTQAFAKFYECISAYPVIESNNFESRFQSVHLCEAPGAFVASMNHYLKVHHPQIEFNWRASTLNPYYEGNSTSNTILDDRLILHTLENWMFCENYDGDILQEINIKSLIRQSKSLGPIHLVTADGSIDCLHQPESQEEFVSKLHLAEFICGLGILSNNGSMIIKLFTFFENSSICMLYILSCCFREIHIFKPATSKEGNSEVYVICLGYKKHLITDEILEVLISNFKDDTKSLLPLEIIPADFMQQLIEAARFFMLRQISVIENNIKTFKKYDKMEFERIKYMKMEIVNEFIKRYHITPIEVEQKLLYGFEIINDINLNVKIHSGSHSERIGFQNLPREEQIEVHRANLRLLFETTIENSMNLPCIPFKLFSLDLNPQNFIKLIHGRSIKSVASSKFTVLSLIKFYNELRTFFTFSSIQDEKLTVHENHIIINLEAFVRCTNYDKFEKSLCIQFLKSFSDFPFEVFIIENLPLLTQFFVGVVLYLALFVFQEVHFKRSSGTIVLKSFRIQGKENLKILSDILIKNRKIKRQKSVVGICNTKTLFTLNQEFYRSIVDYNNHLCLKMCSFLLKIKESK